MPATSPPKARNDWSEGVADEVARWIEELVSEQAVPRDEYREVLSRLDVVETRLDGLDTRLDETNARLDRMEERFEKGFDAMNRQFDDRFDAMNERLDRLHEAMRTQTRWAIGVLALFGTMTTVLMAVAVFGGG
jgi:tetrahydromethanopterin S-methyltransferase subunit G